MLINGVINNTPGPVEIMGTKENLQGMSSREIAEEFVKAKAYVDLVEHVNKNKKRDSKEIRKEIWEIIESRRLSMKDLRTGEEIVHAGKMVDLYTEYEETLKKEVLRLNF